VTLRLSPAARWVIERYPVDEVVERRGGSVDATFPVASERWLERLLVRLGPEAEVRAPAEWRGLGAAVADRLLARYAEATMGE
jgi:proteasome accessory factor C